MNHLSLREKHIIGDRTRERLVGAAACPAIASAGLRLVGMSWAETGFDFVRLASPVGQVLACIAGEGEVWIDGAWHRCGRGQVYVTPQGELHAYRAAGPWELCWLMWSPGQSWKEFDAWPAPRLVSADVEPLAAAIHGLLCESGTAQDEAAQRVWMQMVRHYARKLLTPATLDIRLLRLWRDVSADLARPWTIGDLARHAGVSPEHLRRLCVQWHGTSPMRHVVRLRIERASELLLSNDLKIEFIARQVGYDNAFAFSTAFRRVTGRRPSEWRLARR